MTAAARLSDIVARAATPGHPALVRGTSTLSYADLQAEAAKTAAGLGDMRGKRVGLLFQDGMRFVPAFFAALSAGASVVPLNPDAGSEAVIALLRRSRCAKLLTDLGDRAPVLPAMEAGQDASEDEAMVLYTSGTTAQPKGVVHSDAGLLANARAVAQTLGLGPEDATVLFLPLNFSYGLSQMLSTLLAGGTLILESFFHPAFFIKRLRETGATGFGGVAPHHRLLIAHCASQAPDLPRLRWVMNAGGPLSDAELRGLQASFPKAAVINAYGCTEIGPRATQVPFGRLKDKPGSIGLPIPGVTVSLVDDSGRQVPTGETGEIVLSGASLMKGYLDEPELNARVLGPLGFRTNDLAARDAEGFLYYKGRKDDLFKSGGEKINSRLIEEVLMAHDAVSEALVVGIPDPTLDYVPKAVIVTKPGRSVTAEELTVFARARLPLSHLPRHLQFIDALAKTPNGKVQKFLYMETPR